MKVFDDGQRDIGLDQRGAHFAERRIDIGLAERAAPAKLVEYAAEAGLQDCRTFFSFFLILCVSKDESTVRPRPSTSRG